MEDGHWFLLGFGTGIACLTLATMLFRYLWNKAADWADRSDE